MGGQFRRVLRACVVSALALLVAAPVFADYPDKPVKVVVGFAAGSSADVAARITAEELSKELGQRFIIEIKAGAGSAIAGDSVAKGEADGYQLFLGSVANIITTAMKKGAGFDLAKDLKPVALICSVPNILVVHPSVNATSVKELIALAKVEGDKLNYGSPGPGTIPHLSAELFKTMAGVAMVHVPYTGTAQAAQDLLAGRLHVMFSPASTVLGQIEAKSLRALAWTTAKRGASLPDLPTVEEAGLPGFETSIWFGLNAPHGVPEPIIQKLAAATLKAVKSPTIVKAFQAQGIEPVEMGTAAYGKYIADEVVKWTEVAAKAGLVK